MEDLSNRYLGMIHKGEPMIWRTKMQARVLARVQGRVLGFNLLQMNPN
jgi:hypothetical protein